MAVAVDAHSTNTPSTLGTSESITHACSGTNRLLVVTVSTYGTTLPTGATYNGVALTQQAQPSASASGNSTRTITVYTLTAPATGANTLTVTFNDANGSHGIFADSLDNVDQATPLGTVQTATVNATTASTTAAAATGDLVVSGVHCRSTTAPTATGTSQTIIDSLTTASPNALAAVASQPGAASVTSSWSWGAVADNGAAFSLPVKWDGGVLPVSRRNTTTTVTRAVTRAAVI